MPRPGHSQKLACALATVALLLTSASPAFAGKELSGRWVLRITIPEAPGSTVTRTFNVTLDVSPRGASLHGRANMTDEAGRMVGAAWRQTGKSVSIAYELPCPGDGPCGREAARMAGVVRSPGAERHGQRHAPPHQPLGRRSQPVGRGRGAGGDGAASGVVHGGDPARAAGARRGDGAELRELPAIAAAALVGRDALLGHGEP